MGLALSMSAVFGVGVLVFPSLGSLVGLLAAVLVHVTYNSMKPKSPNVTHLAKTSPVVKVEEMSPAEDREKEVEKALRLLVPGGVPHPLTHDLRIDKPLVLDSAQRAERKTNFLNLTSLLGNVSLQGAASAADEKYDFEELRDIYYLSADELKNRVEKFERRVQELAGIASQNDSDFRRGLARNVAQRVLNCVSHPDGLISSKSDLELFMSKTASQIGLLHSLGGSLFQMAAGLREQKKSLSSEQRARYQRQDLQWLFQVPFLLGPSVEAGVAGKQKEAFEVLEKAVASYNQMGQQSFRLSSSVQSLSAAWESGQSILVQVSQNLLDESAELTASELSQLNLIMMLARGLEQDAGLWGGRKVIFQIEGQVRQPVSVIQALEKRAMRVGLSLSTLKNDPRVRVVSSDEISGFKTAAGEISAKAVMDYLVKIGCLGMGQGLNIFALQDRVWNLTGVEGFVNLIVMLAGDIVCNATLKIDKALQNLKILRIQA